MDPNNNLGRRQALRLFGVIASSILLYFALLRFSELAGILLKCMAALEPVLIGIALAFMLRPAQVRLEKWIRTFWKRPGIAQRAISVGIVLSVTLGVISVFCISIFPQLTDSIKSLIKVVPGQVNRLLRQLEDLSQANAEISNNINTVVLTLQNFFTNWIQTELLGSLTSIIGNVMAMLTSLVNIILALVVSVYLLMGWERYVAQCKKLFLAASRNERLNQAVFESMAQTNRIFNGFIVGKLVDSLIVGVICFFFMTILGMPYTVLISFIIGVTNIIPMFGPFIGAIPSAFLILLVSPVQCLIFVIFILVLQQVDGNIIGPRILGNSTGMSALYVSIGILLFSHLMGFIGMVIGVPLFATIYYLIKRIAEAQLRKRSLSTKTEDYMSESKK